MSIEGFVHLMFIVFMPLFLLITALFHRAGIKEWVLALRAMLWPFSSSTGVAQHLCLMVDSFPNMLEIYIKCWHVSIFFPG